MQLQQRWLLYLQVFTSIALFGILIVPLNAFPWVINGMMEAWVSVNRLQRYMKLTSICWTDYYSTSPLTGAHNTLLLTYQLYLDFSQFFFVFISFFCFSYGFFGFQVSASTAAICFLIFLHNSTSVLFFVILFPFKHFQIFLVYMLD